MTEQRTTRVRRLGLRIIALTTRSRKLRPIRVKEFENTDGRCARRSARQTHGELRPTHTRWRCCSRWTTRRREEFTWRARRAREVGVGAPLQTSDAMQCNAYDNKCTPAELDHGLRAQHL
jgi:hypothetical protein